MFIPTANNVARKPRITVEKFDVSRVAIPLSLYRERALGFERALLPTPGLYDGIRNRVAYEHTKTFYFGDGQGVTNMLDSLGNRVTSEVFDRVYAIGSLDASSLTEAPLSMPLYLDPNLRTPVFDPDKYCKQQYFGKVPTKVTVDNFIIDYVNAVVFERKRYAQAATPEQILQEAIDPTFIHRNVPHSALTLQRTGWCLKPDVRLNFFNNLELQLFSTMRDQIHTFLDTKPWEVVNVVRSGDYLTIERTGQDWRINDWMEKFGNDYD